MSGEAFRPWPETGATATPRPFSGTTNSGGNVRDNAQVRPSLCRSKSHRRWQVEQVKTKLAAWLAPSGLSFNEDKTRIVHLTEGFDFLTFSKFRGERWVFGDRVSGAYLPKPSWTEIVRHTLVKGGASPDDPDLTRYWAERRRKVKPPLDSYTVRLLSKQDGRCPCAGTIC